MKTHLNTLYVTTQGTYLGREGDAVEVRCEQEVKLRVPIRNLNGIVCFGRVGMSPAAMELCSEHTVAVSFVSMRGRFMARVEGPVSGNVLLRRAQYRRADDLGRSGEIARVIVAAKVANARVLLQRAARDHASVESAERLKAAAGRIGGILDALTRRPELDAVRGLEGEAASEYFGVFNDLILATDAEIMFSGRNRRPPLDPVNAMLSFLYTLLLHDVRSALETVGLDPAVGFLHRDRPGRPGLALDLMEELRAVMADRVTLTLLNRRQVTVSSFVKQEAGGVLMTDAGRKTVLEAWQERKNEEITHPFIGERMTMGFVPLIQARLFARYLRGDLDGYPPFLWK